MSNPVVRARRVDGDGTRRSDRGAGDRPVTARQEDGAARVGRVDAVRHRARGGRGRPRHARSVIDGRSRRDRDRGTGLAATDKAGRDRRAVLAHVQALGAGAGGRGVEGVAGVDGLPVEGAGGGEGVGRGVRGQVVGHRVGGGGLVHRVGGALVVGEVGVGDGAPGAGGGPGDDGGVVHRGAHRHREGRAPRRGVGGGGGVIGQGGGRSGERRVGKGCGGGGCGGGGEEGAGGGGGGGGGEG